MGATGSPVRRPRPRLVDPLADAPAVMLEAPGGYGKTTVADLLVDRWEHATLRARLTEPTDLSGLLAEVRRGARRAGLRAVEEAAAGEPELALDGVLHAVATHPEPLAVVLDDVHHLDERSGQVLAHALGDARLTDVRVVVAGRHLGPLAAAVERLGGTLVDADALRLDRDEQRALFDGDDPPPTLLDEVDLATGGWAAAVALSAARWRADRSWSPSTPAGARAVLASLVADLLAQDPSLALLAELPLVDERVCELVGGPGLAAAAGRAGILATRHGGWSSVPDPIAATIRATPHPTLDGNLEEGRRDAERSDGGGVALDAEVLLAVADHYRDQGELGAALVLLDRPGRAEPLVALLARTHWSELAALEPGSLAGALDALAEDGPLGEHPEVLVAAAQAVELADPARRAALLIRASRLAAGGGAGDAVVDRAVRAEQARDAVATHDLDEVAAAVAAIEAEAGPDEEVTVARARTALARAQVFACTRSAMRAGAEEYERAANGFRRAGEQEWLADTLARRGYTALFFEGRMVDGVDEMQRALALLPAGDVTRGIWLANYADVLDTVGRVAEADAAVSEVLEIGHRFSHPALLGMAWWSASWIASRRGDVDATAHALDELGRDLDRWARPGQVVEVYASAAECWARLGREQPSATELDRARAAAEPLGYEAPWSLARARHDALFGDPDAAIARLDDLARDGSEGVIPISEPGRQVLRALAEARRGAESTARDLLAGARAESARFGVPDLVDRLEAEAVRRIEERTDAGGSSGEPTPGAPSSATVVYLLDGFSVKAGGRDMTPHPGYPSTLVKLLVLQGAMTSDAAIDALWPDVDLTTGRSRLRNLLNRLRSRAGDLVVRDGDLLRVRPGVTTDVQAFEDRATEALTAPDAEQVGLARLALALYPGPLLPGDLYEDWAAGPRERLKRRFLALLDLVADDAVARGDADEAIRLLDEGIAAEPLDQRRYVDACHVLVASDRVGSARTLARRGVAVMADIGVEPDPELAALAG